MAGKDESKRNGATPSRVYKSSDVHKRKVNRRGGAGTTEGTPKGAREPQDSGSPNANQVKTNSDQPKTSQSPVFISPEFGKKTAASKASDARWFAAMAQSMADEAPDKARDQDPGKTSSEPFSAADGATEKSEAKPGKAQGASRRKPQPKRQGRTQAKPNDKPKGTLRSRPEGKPEGDLEAASRENQKGKSQEAPQGAPREDGNATPPETDEAPGAQNKESDAADAAKPGAGTSKKRPSTQPSEKSRLKRRIALGVGVAILIAVIVGGLLFAWNRWYRFDDHADMQGPWYVVGTAVAVSIDASAIHLSDDVVYTYEIDPQDKTIRYTFGPYQGQGRYWFSDDRKYLVITDGDGFTSTSTAVDDLLAAVASLPDKVTGAGLRLPEGEGIIAFSREADPEALARKQQEEAARAAAEKAKAEEEARLAAEQEAAEEAYYYG